MGQWLSKYGESIYETRPFVEFGEGPTRLEKGGWFVKMEGTYGPEDIRYTRKGDTVYAIILGWPGENKAVTMTMFGQDGKAQDVKIKNVSMLGTNEKIKWERQDSGLIVTTPSRKVDDLAIVFKLGTSG